MKKDKYPNVLVLMSSYNGQQYICEQIRSILAQTHVNLTLLVRDDGSSDGTQEILYKISSEKQNVQFRAGENIGAAASFLDLMYSLDNIEAYDFIALSDQDDIWLPDKMIKAINAIDCFNTPALYYSALCVFDNKTNEEKMICNTIEYTFEESLFKSNSPGCTMLINSIGINRLLRNGKPKSVVMHDSYIYQFFKAHNYEIVYDKCSYIKYRVHGNNVSVKKSGFSGYIKHIKKIYINQKKLRRDAIRELYVLNQNDISDKLKNILCILYQYDSNIRNLFKSFQIVLNTRLKAKSKFEIIMAMFIGCF
ncbi:MAG: glycosyltransferase [Thomasclavelia ramosa]|nr:glycosyltransferase [Thomasclavelia ramosa]